MADLTPRKGYKQLLRAYCEEFDKGEDVSLTMKVYSNGFTQKEQNACKARIKKHARSMGYEINKNTPTIYFYGNCLPNDCVSRFINTFDCIVSPHCCEGWGLVLSHSMLLGKPVIATKYSGNMDFANEHNSYLVPIGGLEKADDEMIALNENYRGVTWPTISIEKLKRTMRYVYENKEDACMIGKTAQDDIKQKYNYSETSSLFYKHITTILNEKNNSNNTSIQK
jgi:glycosyltransferase involved in cell wall biosynthesis